MLNELAHILDQANQLHTSQGYLVRMFETQKVLMNDHSMKLCEAGKEYHLPECKAFNLVNDGKAELVRE